MKPPLKYSITLFLLLLIGYSQMFAHVYRGALYSPNKNVKDSQYGKALIIKSAEIEEVYIEEDEEKEDERFIVKKYSEEDNSHFTSAHLKEYYFFQRIKSSLSFRERISNKAAFVSPHIVFCVFRV